MKVYMKSGPKRLFGGVTKRRTYWTDICRRRLWVQGQPRSAGVLTFTQSLCQTKEEDEEAGQQKAGRSLPSGRGRWWWVEEGGGGEVDRGGKVTCNLTPPWPLTSTEGPRIYICKKRLRQGGGARGRGGGWGGGGVRVNDRREGWMEEEGGIEGWCWRDSRNTHKGSAAVLHLISYQTSQCCGHEDQLSVREAVKSRTVSLQGQYGGEIKQFGRLYWRKNGEWKMLTINEKQHSIISVREKNLQPAFKLTSCVSNNRNCAKPKNRTYENKIWNMATNASVRWLQYNRSNVVSYP